MMNISGPVVLRWVALLALGASAVMIACRESGAPSTDAALSEHVSASSVAPLPYSPSELHEANPKDWVGRAHNMLLAMVITEWKKPGIRFVDLCPLLLARFEEPGAFQGEDLGFPADWKDGLSQAFRQSVVCRRRSTFRNTAASGGELIAIVEDFSSAAYDLFDDIQVAVDESSTPTELASALSPILNASYALDDTDEAGVQAVLAVAQSSFEYWYADNYAAIIAVENETATDFLDGCSNGSMENEQYEAEGQTFQCQDHEWRMVLWRSQGSLGLAQLVSSPSRKRETTVLACPTPESSHKILVAGDVAGGMAGAVLGIGGTPAGMLVLSVASSAASSTGVAWVQSVISFFCALL